MNSNKNPILTVRVITYNHCKYISKALDSVFSQITDYPYEVLIHDDASTDGTAEIVKKYKEKYPDKVTLILQKENIYSNRPGSILYATMPFCKGKYVITLEGDDYWCDERKIHKQIEFMESNPDYVAATHKCRNVRIDCNGNIEIIGFSPESKKNDLWDINEVIDWADAPHTTSVMFKMDFFRSIPENLYDIKAGDWRNMVLLCAEGKVYYLDEVMSTHVLFTKGSYSEKKFGKGIYNKYEDLMERRQQWCDMLDEATGHQYHDCFVYSQERRWGQYYWEKGEYRKASRLKGFYKGKSIRKKIVLTVISLVPGAEKVYISLIEKHKRITI